MSEHEGQLNHRSEKLNLSQEDYKNTEEKLLLAFAQLRLLSDGEDPLSLNQATSRAHRLRETYKRWKESAATITGISVRLSNGQEVTLSQIKESHECGLRLNASFPAGTVLNVWKKADRQFGEVLLFTLPLSNIPPQGFRVERKYPNGQTVSLKVEHCPNEAFSILAHFTEPEAQHLLASESENHSSLPLAQLMGFLSALRVRRSLSLAYSLVVMIIAVGFLDFNLSQRSSNLVRAPLFEPEAYSNQSRANVSLASKSVGAEEVAYSVAQKSTAVPRRRFQQTKAGAKSIARRVRTIPVWTTHSADISKSIYVAVDTSGNARTDEYLREAFTSALKRTGDFNVEDSEGSRQADLRIEVRLEESETDPGMLIIALFDKDGNILWTGSKAHISPATGTFSEGALQNLISEVMRTLRQDPTADSYCVNSSLGVRSEEIAMANVR